MYPGNSAPITVCGEVYQINRVLLKSVPTSSILSWCMGNVLRSVPLLLPSTKIHIIYYVAVYIRTYVRTYMCTLCFA